MKKVIVASFLAFALIFIVEQSNQAEASYPATVVNIRTFLSLRSEPSSYSRELARIPNGAYVEVMSNDERARREPIISNGFYRVGYKGIYGWAHSNYIYIGD